MVRFARALQYGLAAAVVLGLGKFHAAAIGDYDFTSSFRFNWSLAFIGLLCVAAYGLGLPERARDAYEALGLAATAAGVAALAVSIAQLVVGEQVLPRFVVLWSAVFVVPGWTLCCFVAVRGARRASRRDRVVAVVDSDHDIFESDVRMAPERRVRLEAMVRPEAAEGTTGERPLLELLRRTDATLLVLDRVAQANPAIVAQAALAHAEGVRVRPLSVFYEDWLGKLPIPELEQVSLLFDIGEVHRSRYVGAKRLLDMALGLVGVMVLLVLWPIVVIGNVVANRGPVMYRQLRVGKNGTTFTIIKFRTMRPHAAEPVNEWTDENDPRITPFGRVLRRSHLDELPQALNVLAGDLSIVGPRPEQPQYVDQLTEKIPFYGLRHLVRPGLTGWAQVKYGYAGNESDALEKLQYDFFYLRHQSLGLDIRIIGRTVREILGRGGR